MSTTFDEHEEMAKNIDKIAIIFTAFFIDLNFGGSVYLANELTAFWTAIFPNQLPSI